MRMVLGLTSSVSFESNSTKGSIMGNLRRGMGISVGAGRATGGVISQGQGVGSLSAGERSDSGGERTKKRGKR